MDHTSQPAGIDRRPALDPSAVALLVATVLTGLSAGFFSTYEASVTLGLAEVGDLAYVESFQAINETIRNPAFAAVFFGSIPAVVVAIALNWARAGTVARVLLVAVLGLYLSGMAVTVTGNVPLNDDLAAVTSLTPETAAAARSAFESDWNRLNLIRSLAFGAAFVILAAVPVVAPIGSKESEERPPMGQTR